MISLTRYGRAWWCKVFHGIARIKRKVIWKSEITKFRQKSIDLGKTCTHNGILFQSAMFYSNSVINALEMHLARCEGLKFVLENSEG